MKHYCFDAYRSSDDYDIFSFDDYEECKEVYSSLINDLHLGCSEYINCSFMYISDDDDDDCCGLG